MISKSSIHERMVWWVGWTLAGILMLLLIAILNVQKTAIIDRNRLTSTTMIQTAIIPINDALYNAGDKSDDILHSFVSNFALENQNTIKFVVVLDENGRVIAHSDITQDGQIYSDIYSLAALEASEPKFHIYSDEKFGSVMEVTAPLGLVSLSKGAIRLGLDSEPLKSELRRTVSFILLMFSGTLVLSLLFVYRISRTVTRQLRHTTEVIDTFDFQAVKPLALPESDDEIGLLNDRFLKLQQRLIDARSSMEKTNHNLIQTEKLAALGRMAAGVAHEINNPLLGLKNCLHLLQIDPENRSEHLRMLKEGLERIEVTVSSLLKGARKQTGEFKEFDINLSVRDVLNLLGHRLSKEKVITQVILDEDIPLISNNKSGFEEALLNICMNALDAIVGVGTIKLNTSQKSGNIIVEVCDSGPGILDEVQKTMFEPFVTTKEVGKGTGLGLYVTREIIGSMGGNISYFQGELGGAAFKIVLPLVYQYPQK